MRARRRSRELVKVTFVLDPRECHLSGTERVWAESFGLDRYRIKNTPFHVFGVSAEDIVIAREREGRLVYVSVLLRGGHSTFRVVITEGMERYFETHWRDLKRIGCSYEGGYSGGMYAIDVPPASDIYEVYGRLQLGAQAGVWTFEEGHCGHHRR
jgi:hypothetical protein